MKTTDEYEKCWKWPNSPWKTKASWLSYLRSAFRKAWVRNPTKLEKIKQGRFQIPNPNPKSAKRFPTILGARCECCGGVFPLSSGKKEAKNKDYIVVDHITPAGEFKTPEDAAKFFKGLLCVTLDDLRLLCTTCNATYLVAQKAGISFEEAKLERQAIAIMESKKEKEWLIERGIVPGSNKDKRRKQVTDKLKENLNGTKSGT